MNSSLNVDVAVVGAGPAGAVASALLARSGARTALIDKTPRNKPRIGECLLNSGAELLKRRQLPLPSDPGVHYQIPSVHSLWGGVQTTEDTFTRPGGGDWRLDRQRFDLDLRQASIDYGSRFVSDIVCDVQRHGNHWQLTTRHGNRLTADYLIDASGRSAAIARRLGARQITDEPSLAVWAIGNVSMSAKAPTRSTLIESTDAGWWYGCTLPNRKPIAALHCPPSLASRLKASPQYWYQQLSNTSLLAKELAVQAFTDAELHSSDARGLYLDAACQAGWYACGDAALSFDPLSSQGLFNSIATASLAADSILSDEHSSHKIRRYEEHIRNVRLRYRAELSMWQSRR